MYEKRITDLEVKYQNMHKRQNTLELMVMILWSGFSRNTENGDLTPATILFCVIGAMRFVTLIKCILHWEQTSSFTKSLIVLHCLQLVKDWYVADKVARNHTFVQTYLDSNNAASLATLNCGMVNLRHDVLMYLSIFALPLAIIWFQKLDNRHTFPKFSSSLARNSYYIVLSDWMVTTICILVFYTSPARFVYRYATVGQFASMIIKVSSG
jgi:hypothetical protein